MKLLILSSILILSIQVRAELSSKLVMGMLANCPFNQGIIEESKSSLDFAISGNGWIPLQDDQGRIFFTRHGSFGMNKQGFLYHVPSGYRLITVSEHGGLELINIEKFGSKEFKDQPGRTSTANVISFDAEGNLNIFYSDGEEKRISKIYLAVIENQRDLKLSIQGKHIFETGSKVGEIGYALPMTNSTGKIFPRALEQSMGLKEINN